MAVYMGGSLTSSWLLSVSLWIAFSLRSSSWAMVSKRSKVMLFLMSIMRSSAEYVGFGI